VLIGTLEILLEDATPDATMREDLGNARGAAVRISEIVRKLGAITAYHTKPYTEDITIVDIDRSAETQT
jgi:hypothetical protein